LFVELIPISLKRETRAQELQAWFVLFLTIKPGRPPMPQFKNNLDHVRIAAPCYANWDSMFGDERVRFCGQCKLNVYNLSDMTKIEAERLVARADGRLCIRYYMRRDGSILTNNFDRLLRRDGSELLIPVPHLLTTTNVPSTLTLQSKMIF
jgi:hypothetical protein